MKNHPFLAVAGSGKSGTPRRLHADASTTLGAAGANHATAATGFHANKEAVRTLATHDGRLVSALHELDPYGKSGE
jgi:hypothetical protein